MSGSWVVRDGKLCGVVYAGYERSPYLHMLPTEEIFQDIAELLEASTVRVATAADLDEHNISFETLAQSNIGRLPFLWQQICSCLLTGRKKYLSCLNRFLS